MVKHPTDAEELDDKPAWTRRAYSKLQAENAELKAKLERALEAKKQHAMGDAVRKSS